MNAFSYITYPSGHKAGVSSAYILMHPNLPRWVLINETFHYIACLLNEGMSIDQVASSISTRFGISLQSARDDVSCVADKLVEHCLLSPFLEHTAARVPRLSDLFLHLTDRCNLSCPHCYYPNNSSGDISYALVKRMVDEMFELGGKTITLSGGEPLLYFHVRALLEYATPKLHIRLLTNGTLVDREWAGFLSSSGVVSVQISIDGSRKEIHDIIRGKGAFDKAIKGIEHLQEAGLGGKITISTTVMKQNIRDLGGIIGLAEKMGIQSIRFLPLRKAGRAESLWNEVGASLTAEDYEVFYDMVLSQQTSQGTSLQISCGLSGFLLAMPDECQADGIWCPVGKKLVVSTNGDTFPCVLMMREEFKLGNVFYNNLTEIMKSKEITQIYKELTERKTKIEKCSSCLWRNFCQAGCMGQVLDEKETIWDTDRFCEYRQKLYEKTFQALLKQFASHSRNEGDGHKDISDIEPECNPTL